MAKSKKQTLYAYLDGVDFESVVDAIEPRLDALVEGRTWQANDVWVVNQREPSAWDLGINLACEAIRRTSTSYERRSRRRRREHVSYGCSPRSRRPAASRRARRGRQRRCSSGRRHDACGGRGRRQGLLRTRGGSHVFTRADTLVVSERAWSRLRRRSDAPLRRESRAPVRLVASSTVEERP
jgi:hypothetical protein